MEMDYTADVGRNESEKYQTLAVMDSQEPAPDQFLKGAAIFFNLVHPGVLEWGPLRIFSPLDI